MTAVRPENAGTWDPGEDRYAEPGAFQAAIDSLHDPLLDPLPGTARPTADPAAQEPSHEPAAYPYQEQPYDPYAQPYDYQTPPAHGYEAAQAHDPETLGLRVPPGLSPDSVPPPPPPDPEPAPPSAAGGRAARRKAEKARRATRAGKIANVIGELMITTGAVLVLFVVYQLWWTNVEARAHADRTANSLIDQWDEAGAGASAETPQEPDDAAGAFAPGEGFAVLYLPTLDVRVPIAEGVDPESVLDRGMVGHYADEDGLPTAMPWDEAGNVGLAGHRNTHGEPFRYINKLDTGDPIVVETESTFYTYEMRSRLDSTAPSNIQVLDPVPDQGGFDTPGRYITLTTCTPEFTSTYRLIVWGELVEERPRSEGKPDALLN